MPTNPAPAPSVAVGLSITPPALSLIVGSQLVFTARAYDAQGRTVTASFAWSSANPAIATVSDGSVTAYSAGTTTVTVTCGTLGATGTVTVRPLELPVAVSLGISPSELTLIEGDFERLTAYAWDSSARPINVSVEWSSADLSIATVGEFDGIVTAISLGATTVTAAAGTLRATVSVVILPTAGALSGTFAFTRGTRSSAGDITFDVLTLSAADRTPRSLPRPAQFASILAPAWSPDGALLAVEAISVYFPYDWHDYNSDLYVLNAAAPADALARADHERP